MGVCPSRMDMGIPVSTHHSTTHTGLALSHLADSFGTNDKLFDALPSSRSFQAIPATRFQMIRSHLDSSFLFHRRAHQSHDAYAGSKWHHEDEQANLHERRIMILRIVAWTPFSCKIRNSKARWFTSSSVPSSAFFASCSWPTALPFERESWTKNPLTLWCYARNIDGSEVSVTPGACRKQSNSVRVCESSSDAFGGEAKAVEADHVEAEPTKQATFICR